MEIYISQQLALFSGAALLGAVLGLAYDLLRSVRRRWQRLLAVCDVLFCLAVAAGSIGYTLRAAGGELRLYLAVGMVLSGVVFPGFQRAAASTVGLLDRCGSVLSASLCAPAAAGQSFFAKSRPAPEKTLSFLV